MAATQKHHNKLKRSIPLQASEGMCKFILVDWKDYAIYVVILHYLLHFTAQSKKINIRNMYLPPNKYILCIKYKNLIRSTLCV